MDEIQCSHCKFVTTPADMAANSNACPNCNRLYRSQPNPSPGMRLRDVPPPAADGMDDMGGNPLKEGILADGGWQNRQRRDESFASVRLAEFALPGEQQAPSGGGFDTAFPTHKFIVSGDGTVFDSPEPTTHEQIAQHLGDTEAHLRHGALGELFGHGGTNWYSNGSNLTPQELQEALTTHYGYPVDVDPSHPGLGVRTQENRFGLPEVGRGRELNVLDGPALPRSYNTIPGEKEWQLRGGKTAMQPDLGVPFETTGIALPGHTTEDVTPSDNGLHGEVLGALNDLGAYVNGRKVDVQNDPGYADYLKTHFSGASPPEEGEHWGWPENQGQSVMLSHPDPKSFDLAKQVVEQGNRTPLLQHAQQQEAGHPLNLRIPNGITDNLHLALGNLRAWVENPYENGQLRPYYNNYHNILRPELNQRAGGSVRVGVNEPTTGEILNHVAQTDDLTPLYEYRGVQRQSHVKMAGPAAAIPAVAEIGAEALGLGAGEAAGAGAAGAAGAGEAAAAGAGEGASAGGVGGFMNGALSAGKNALSKVPGLGGLKSWGGRYLQFEGLHDLVNNGNPMGTMPAEGGYGPVPGVQSPSFYARTADIETPSSHGEIPQNEDGDTNQKDDGDEQAWQKDYDVNGMGGTDSSPHFDANGPGFERFMMMLPLILHYFTSEESGAHDPLIQGLDQTLEQELPGYKDHGDPQAIEQLLTMIMPKDGEGDDKADDDLVQETKREQTGVDEPTEKESRVDFLPVLPTLEPSRHAYAPPTPGTVGLAPSVPSTQSLTVQGHCPHCGGVVDPTNATCPQCGAATGSLPQHQNQSNPIQARTAEAPGSFMYEHSDVPPGMTLDQWRLQEHPQKGELTICPACHRQYVGEACPDCGTPAPVQPHMAASHQGPHTPEQISAVQQLLIDQGRVDEVPDVPLYPEQYADELSQITGTDPPPVDDTQQGGQPEPAMEEAPPGDTMPVPGMSAPQQMQSAVARYAADSVSNACPECGSHTTRLIDKKSGKSECHNCGHQFHSDVQLVDVGTTARTALQEPPHHTHPNVKGVPAADQVAQRDVSQEQDSGHTWTDSNGDPLKVGQEYEMYSAKYDIPDIIRIEQVKPDSLVYTLTGQYGLEHSTELSYEEAQIDKTSFKPSDQQGELQPENDIEQNDDNDTAYEGSPETTDLSRPHALVSASVKEGSSGHEWLNDGSFSPRQAGKKYGPWEQRDLIEEAGEARNAGKLDLSGTHYEAAMDDQDAFLFGL